jgi:hypothetical protein
MVSRVEIKAVHKKKQWTKIRRLVVLVDSAPWSVFVTFCLFFGLRKTVTKSFTAVYSWSSIIGGPLSDLGGPDCTQPMKGGVAYLPHTMAEASNEVQTYTQGSWLDSLYDGSP